nr:hypothetical protein [Tanacetum cinerariifolium]
MENVPPSNNNLNVLEEEPILDQAPAALRSVCPGPMCYDLKSVHRGVKRLSMQMQDSYRTEKKMEKKLKQDELRMNGLEFDITALDLAVRENRFENYNMMKLITSLSRGLLSLGIRTTWLKS